MFGRVHPKITLGFDVQSRVVRIEENEGRDLRNPKFWADQNTIMLNNERLVVESVYVCPTSLEKVKLAAGR